MTRTQRARYEVFKALVKAGAWTLGQLRCDESPPDEQLLEAMEIFGLEKWELFTLQFQTDQN